MNNTARIMKQAESDSRISERSLIDLKKELYWVILRARHNVSSICEEAGFTPEEAGLQFIHPTMGPRRNYTMICLKVE